MLHIGNVNSYVAAATKVVCLSLSLFVVSVVIKILMKVFFPHVYSSTIYFCVGFFLIPLRFATFLYSFILVSIV